MLSTVRAMSYLTPLREGGSLPGLVEADDDGIYVVKFRGAGQGTAALIADLVVGSLGHRLGVRVPELVLIDLDPQIAKREPDEEVQQLLANSSGTNLGVDFLPGSVGFPPTGFEPPAEEAAAIFWLDAYAANVDRTWRNPNLLVWHRTLWAIDHGAALIFQHTWPGAAEWSTQTYCLTEHALRAYVDTSDRTVLDAVDERLTSALTPELIDQVLADVPDDWLTDLPAARDDELSPDDWRKRYAEYLRARLEDDRPWREWAT